VNSLVVRLGGAGSHKQIETAPELLIALFGGLRWTSFFDNINILNTSFFFVHVCSGGVIYNVFSG
jgi:hypothetical protein